MGTFTTRYRYAALLVVALAGSACSSKPSPEDKEVQQMDSVSAALEKSDKELAQKTKDVEASLEKIDKELKSTGNEK